MAYSDKKYFDRQCIMIMNDDRGLYNNEIDVFTRLNVPKDITFSDGRPTLNTIYVAHPAKKGFYVPLSNHEEAMFRDKMDELIMLLQALGAIDIEIIRTEGMSMEQMYRNDSNIGGSVGVKAFSASADYRTSQSNTSGSASRKGYHLKVKSNDENPPFVPTGLNWFSISPEWEKMVKQRLLGMQEYELELSSSYSSSISSSKFESIKAAAKYLCVHAGISTSYSMENSFKRSEEIVWKLKIKFRPLNEYKSQSSFHSFSNGQTGKLIKSTPSQDKAKYKDSCKKLIPKNGKISDVIRIELNRLRDELSISAEEATAIEAEFIPKKKWFGLF